VADPVLLVAASAIIGLLAGSPAGVATTEPANCEPRRQETAATAHTSLGLDDFGWVTASLDGADGAVYTLCVLVADTPELRGRGLMDVADAADLGHADAMAFVWGEPTTARFYMWQTPLPLTLAFFDAEGAWIGGADMDPCVGDDASVCERFSAPTPYCVGLEVPRGTFGDALGPGASLSLDPIATSPATSTPPSCEV